MVTEEPKESSPDNPKLSPPKQPENGESIFSPRFRSVAAMAGWDEEALLNASLVVEDTPDRDAKQKRRSDLQFKTPPTNSRRKRKAQRKSPALIPVAILNLDEDETSKEDGLKVKEELKINENVVDKLAAAADNRSNSGIPCMDKLREELSCAICLEICYEPSTTPCGHSFCKKCLRSAADKCGKRCPKCRQLISNGRSSTVNTVLWNTIQLLFPQEVEARKAAAGHSRSPPVRVSRNRTIQALNSPEGEGLNLERRRNNHNLRNRSVRPSVTLTRGDDNLTRRRTRDDVPSQDEDAALALRLQQDEFMGVFRGPEEQQQQHRSQTFVSASTNLRGTEERQQQQQQHRRSSVTLATANLRAMASRAINIRLRGRGT